MITNAIYKNLISDILSNGYELDTRNSVTKRLINLKATFDSSPLISIRKTAWKSAIREMEWFLSGSTDIEKLHPSVRHWWEPWANEHGHIPNNYSSQFRHQAGWIYDPELHSNAEDEEGPIFCDQIQYLIDCLTNDPNSRRAVITTWNTAEMTHKSTPITNCHNTMTQLFVMPDNTIEMITHQRSCDMILGVPHNWIQQWAFMMWLAHRSGRKPGKVHWTGGDCHIYKDHYDVAEKMILEDGDYAVPNLVYTPTSKGFKADDFTLDSEYKPSMSDSPKMIV